MTARALMLQGTGSNVGKSLLTAGLCRLFANRGLTVRPFKPQNMSNNAAVTIDGGEIGRAQALQARAARVEPHTDMNPVLLKPESGTGAQVIVQGKRHSTLSARAFFNARQQFLPPVLDSFWRLASDADLVLVEGAGSPAEINLRQGDLANMGFAEAADIPAILIADIHRGGVIASVAGTFQVIAPRDADRLKGFVINRFHGDPSLFDEGRIWLERNTARPCLGVLPHFADAIKLPAEDSVALEENVGAGSRSIKIAVPKLARIANFDDFDPLRLEPGVDLQFIHPGEPIPGDAAVVILAGSKSTIADLEHARKQGWDIDITAHVRRGGRVFGICGGYQMMGRRIHDPEGLEGKPGSCGGLGLLDVETTLEPEKTLRTVTAHHAATGAKLAGYEIHLGTSSGPDCARPFARIGERHDGAVSTDGRHAGTYLHGCFASDAFRRTWLGSIGAGASALAFDQTIDGVLDNLADHLAEHIDIARLLTLAEPAGQAVRAPAP